VNNELIANALASEACKHVSAALHEHDEQIASLPHLGDARAQRGGGGEHLRTRHRRPRANQLEQSMSTEIVLQLALRHELSHRLGTQ
jgi:hypothetical protein